MNAYLEFYIDSESTLRYRKQTLGEQKHQSKRRALLETLARPIYWLERWMGYLMFERVHSTTSLALLIMLLRYKTQL
ncbi:unnamed protein product [Kuraishia capsulata CBS 1993]|uniref:Uncharacterized protein n=1 Tax=Kuraishia capsulata CBS 1993 TaxID=1382522 RepID=W6MSM0_9ASCO|nr:uncharacterized protein KUCA_T00000751001 [Kuraishia capsulata CBS 1993]CDK24785.1 unnamed protein product [Kuraishia capsulata CBS 1993]